MFPVITIVILLQLSLNQVKAWGPVSHYYFACSYFSPSSLSWSSTVDCVCHRDSESAPFIFGSELPDAFYFGDLQSSICTDAIGIHDPIFAGYLIKWAREENAFLLDSFGFASHIIADQVGFHDQGWLGNSDTPMWLNIWPLMQLIDSAFYLNISASSATSCDLPHFAETSDSFVRFFAASTQRYANLSSASASFPALSEKQVYACIDRWSSVLDGQYNITQATTHAVVDTMLPALSPYAKQDVGVGVQILDALSRVHECVKPAMQTYFDAIYWVGGATPEEAWNMTANLVDTMFQEKRCVPNAQT